MPGSGSGEVARTPPGDVAREEVVLVGSEGAICWVRACAKVNPYLRIVGKRPDGYHQIETLMVAIPLADELRVERLDHAAGRIELRCDDPTLPTGPDNLVWAAVEAYRARTGFDAGVRIDLTKRIPHGAGLGGGSADAAATLLALDALATGEVRPLDQVRDRLVPMAASLGSDTTWFLFGGPAMSRGRGEQITPWPLELDVPIVLLMPRLVVPTGGVFAALHAAPLQDGIAFEDPWEHAGARETSAADKKLCLELFGARLGDPRASPSRVGALRAFTNDLETAARRSVPALDAVFLATDDLCPGRRLLTGSGAALVFYPNAEAGDPSPAELAEELFARGLGETYTSRLQSGPAVVIDGSDRDPHLAPAPV